MIAIIIVIITIISIIIIISNISDLQIRILRFMFVGRKFKTRTRCCAVIALQSEGHYYLFLTTVLLHEPHPLQWRINSCPATFILPDYLEN